MKISEEYFALTSEKRALNQQLASIQEKLDALERELLLWMEDKDLTQIKGVDGTLFIKHRHSAKIENKAAFMDWLKENKMEDMLTVYAVTLSAMAKENPEIPGLAVTVTPEIGHRKAAG